MEVSEAEVDKGLISWQYWLQPICNNTVLLLPIVCSEHSTKMCPENEKSQ